MTPSETGARAEAAVAAALVRAGRTVLLPVFGAHCRYDLAFEDDDGIHRVQCKTGRLAGDTITFRACSQTGKVQRGYADDVEFLAVHCFERDEVYLLPVADAPRTAGRLRLARPRNGQRKRIRWARDYLLRP